MLVWICARERWLKERGFVLNIPLQQHRDETVRFPTLSAELSNSVTVCVISKISVTSVAVTPDDAMSSTEEAVIYDPDTCQPVAVPVERLGALVTTPVQVMRMCQNDASFNHMWRV